MNAPSRRNTVQRSLKAARIATYQTAILDAAQRLFADRGFEAVKMADIARGAGVAKGTLYNYFDSKESVFAALAERGRSELLEVVDAAVAEAPPTDKPRAFVEALFSCLEADAPMVRVYMHVTGFAAGHRADPHCDEGRSALLGRLTEALRPMHAAGAFRSRFTLPRLVVLYAGLLDAALQAWVQAGAEGSLVESIDDIMSLFFEGARV